MNMQGRPPRTMGFSLIETLVVLVILGILAAVGVSMIGNRGSASVRALVDVIEGALAESHQAAVATGRDVTIVTWGNWTAATPMVMAHGDSALPPAVIQATATNLIAGIPPAAAVPLSRSVGAPFHHVRNDRIQTRARISLAGSGDWAAAMTGIALGTNADITTVSPFLPGEPMAGLVADGNNLFTDVRNMTVISGSNRRFNSTFFIAVVGIQANGDVVPGGPMGLVVVLANGASIYKFYNPGIKDGDGKWRRI